MTCTVFDRPGFKLDEPCVGDCENHERVRQVEQLLGDTALSARLRDASEAATTVRPFRVAQAAKKHHHSSRRDKIDRREKSSRVRRFVPERAHKSKVQLIRTW